MKVLSAKTFVVSGAVLAVIVWVFYVPALFDLVSAGDLNPLSLLVVLSSAIFLALAGLRTGSGKSTKAFFALHIVCVAAVALLRVTFWAPMLFGVIVALLGMAISFVTQPGVQADQP